MIWLILWALIAHWVADFILQSDKMALNKSKEYGWLWLHSSIYGCAMAIMVGAWIPVWGGIALILSHALIDGVTSRITSYLWQKEMRHRFFIVIGFDQLLHYVVLLAIMGVPA